VTAAPRTRARQARAWLWPVLSPHRGRVAVAAVAVLTGTAATLLMPYAVKVAIDRGVTRGDLGALRAMVAAYVALALVQFVAGRAETRLVAAIGEQALYDIRLRLFRHLQALSLDFYERERTGRIVARMTNDIEAMANLVTNGLVMLVTSVITLVGVAVILVLLDWRLALATLVVAPAMGLAANAFRTRSTVAYRVVRERATVVTVRLQEALAGARTIQAFRAQPRVLGRIRDANHDEREAHLRTIRYASLFFPAVELVGTVASVIVLGFGGWLTLSSALEVGTLVAFLLYLRSLFDPIQQLSELFDQVQAATAGAERVGAVLDQRPTVAAAAAAVPLRHPRGELALRGVSFGYADGPDVLHDIDLRIAAGTTLALVGPTGAGKSTVAKLVARFYDPRRGTVLLDHHDLRDLSLADLRAAMGYVPQEGFLFSGTVADNIGYGRLGATRAEIEAAAAAVGADAVIRRLPKGYDTEVGERGALLSAGERQLVSFARAWIADPALLILDEATSNLDAASEARIGEALHVLRQGRTTIVIAHRLSTVAQADQIAVIEDGRLLEAGPPGRLLAAGGRFAELYDRWLAGAA
jgi:ABC-type multidrug transport system fused ATPase/permease subunit